MKSKEEIEQLAESQYGTEIGSIRGSNPYDLEEDRKNGYIKGYTQCQEDMVDKKYTEEDMILIRNKLVSILPTGDISAWDMLQSVSKYIKWFDEYINSLNKQD